MKKKDPNDVADTQKYLNFVTPVVENVETSVDQNGNDENGRVHDGMDSSEPNPDIDRLVCCSDNSSKSNRLPSSPVVDLTNDDAAPNQQKTKANVVSASKKRKSPVNKSKAAPAAPTKSISEAFAAAKEISNALSPSKLGPVVVTDVCGNDVVQLEECPAPTVTAESTIAPLDAPVDVPAAPAKKDATTKKRTRKPSVKKTEAVESAALDAPTEGEAGEGHAAVDSKADAADDKEEKQDQTAKPAAKRRRKPTTTPAKAVPVSIVYPPHVEVKLQSNREKLSNLVAELGKLERFTISQLLPFFYLQACV